MARVFISYAREDSDIALRLCSDLRTAGATPWIDSEQLLPGQDWKSEIRNAIRSSDYFVVIFSKNSIGKRGFFQNEVRLALDELAQMPPARISLIPCRLDDVEIHQQPLKDLHWLDLFPSYTDGLEKLKRSLDLSSGNYDDSEESRELHRQADQNLLKYKLAQAEQILNDPVLFSNPTWVSSALLNTTKTKRRLYETITRIQKNIPMFSYDISEIGGGRFVLRFKHIRELDSFANELERQLNNEGVSLLKARTKKDDIPEGSSALVIPPYEREGALIRGSSGRSVLVTSQGAYDVNTGEKVSDEELANLSPSSGFNVGRKKD